MGIPELFTSFMIVASRGLIKGSAAKLDPETLLIQNLTKQSLIGLLFKSREPYISNTTVPMTIEVLKVLQKGKKNASDQ